MPAIAIFIPWLIKFLGTLFTGLFAYAFQFLTRRWALYGAAFALFVTLQITFISAIQGLFATFVVTAPSELVMAWGWIAPTNAGSCMAAIMAAYAARYIYDLNQKFLFKGFSALGGK